MSIPDSSIAFDPVAATYIAPDMRTDVDIKKTGDTVSITIPQLDEWGFVVLAPDPDAVSPPGNANTARNRLSTLTDRIERAEEHPDVPSDERSFIRASVFLQEAQVALEAETYHKAVARANAGLDALATLPAMSTDRSNQTTTDSNETTISNETTSDSNETTISNETTSDSNETTTSDQTTTTDALGFGVVSNALATAAGAITFKKLQDGDEE
jgi:hypothetical protein